MATGARFADRSLLDDAWEGAGDGDQVRRLEPLGLRVSDRLLLLLDCRYASGVFDFSLCVSGTLCWSVSLSLCLRLSTLSRLLGRLRFRHNPSSCR